MTLRTKSEQRAYLDGYEMCAECIEKYLSDKGKKVLECLLISVRNAVDIEDIAELKGNNESKETETWNGYHGQIIAPKGTFKKIYEDTNKGGKHGNS